MKKLDDDDDDDEKDAGWWLAVSSRAAYDFIIRHERVLYTQ